MAGNIEKRLAELGITLPTPPAPIANYVPTALSGQLLFCSGQVSTAPGGKAMKGKLGADVSIEQGQEAARICAINLLAVTQAELGSLDEVARIVKLLAWVASDGGFARQPYVVNGASDLLGEVFGDRGVHARSAIGTNQLPFDIAVEIEMIVEVRKDSGERRR